jgi:hypothetical protein
MPRAALAVAVGTALAAVLAPLLLALPFLVLGRWDSSVWPYLRNYYQAFTEPALVAGFVFCAVTVADNWRRPDRFGHFFTPLREPWLLGALVGAASGVAYVSLVPTGMYWHAAAALGFIAGAMMGPVMDSVVVAMLGTARPPRRPARKLRRVEVAFLAAVVLAGVGIALWDAGTPEVHEHRATAQKPGIEGPSDQRVVARMFEKPFTASSLDTWPRDALMPVQKLRAAAISEAMHRFVAANGLHATEADYEAFAKHTAEFRNLTRERHNRRLGEIQARLARSSGEERARLERDSDSQAKLLQFADERPPTDPRNRVWRQAIAKTIEEHKAYKALHEKYGGDVQLGDSGPYPAGAIARLLREHEKAGDIVFMDSKLQEAFWERAERVPTPARPGQIDFTYYWLKPVTSRYPGYE